MKVHEVPQDDVPDFSEGIKKGQYALDDRGKYVLVPSKGWVVDEFVNSMAYREYLDKLEAARQAVLAGRKSPLAYTWSCGKCSRSFWAKPRASPRFG